MKKIMLQKRIFLTFTPDVKNFNRNFFSLRALLVLLFVFAYVGSAFAFGDQTYYAKVKVFATPTGSGSVYLKQTTNGTNLGQENGQSKSAGSTPTFTWVLYASPKNENYKFLGWAESDAGNLSDFTMTTSEGQSVSIKGNTSEQSATKSYYAHFAKKFFFGAQVKVDDACAGMGNVSASYSSSDAPVWGTTSTPSYSAFATTSGADNLNATLYVKAQAEEGYTFVGWYVDKAAAAASTDSAYNIPYASRDTLEGSVTTKNVVAKFKQIGEKSKTSIGLNYGGVGYDGEDEITIDVDNTFAIEMENAPSATGFTISQISVVDAGETNPVLTYNSGNQTLYANRAGKATFRITQAATDDVTGKDVTFTINVQKRTPQWEYVAGTMYENTNVSNPIHITDGRPEWTLTSGNTNVIPNSSNTNASFKVLYLNNHATQVIPCTFHQDATYKYNEVDSVVNVTVSQNPNHVPINGLNAENIETFSPVISNGAINSDKKSYKIVPPEGFFGASISGYESGSVQLQFEGVPDKLSCTLTGGTGNAVYWKIEEKATANASWEEVTNLANPGSPYQVTNLSIKPTSRYLRFTYGGSGTAGYVKDLKISELHFSSNPDIIICPIGSEEPQSVDIACANVSGITHSFPGTDGDKFTVNTDIDYAGYDSYSKGKAYIRTTATESMKTKWTIHLDQVGGASEQAEIDVYAVKYPVDLPMDLNKKPDDYYYFVNSSNKVSFNPQTKKLEFESGSSTTEKRSIEFYFNGTAGEVSFEPSATARDGAYWNIYEKANKEDSYSDPIRKSYLVYGPSNSFGGVVSVPLKPTTHFVKIELSGSEGMGSLSKFKITKGVYIRSNHNVISFDSDGGSSKTCALTIANVHDVTVSMAEGTNYDVSLSGSELTISRKAGIDPSALYDMVIISAKSDLDNQMVYKRIPVNIVPTTITADNANNTGIKTGTIKNAVSEWSTTSYTITDIDVSGAFADGKAFCDKVYIFDKSYNEVDPTSVTIAASYGNIAITSCHVYSKSGDHYTYSRTIENACSATKDSEFNQTSPGSLKLYYTGFCPMLSSGYTKSDESAIFVNGDGGQSVDVYFDNCFVIPRRKTVEGYGEPAIWNCNGYAEGTASGLAIKNANGNGVFTANIHLRRRNMLYGVNGMTFNYMDRQAPQRNAAITILAQNNKSNTVNIDDIWPALNSEGTDRTNGVLMLDKIDNCCPSIDLGNENTTLNFNGGQITLRNAYTASPNYKTSMAISCRKFMGLVSGMGDDQPEGNVNFNDGTISGMVANGFKNGAGEYDSYYKDPDGNLDGNALRCPLNTRINGGTFNCNIFTCKDVESAGGSPKNSVGDDVCMLNLRATGGVDEKGFAIFEFPYSKVSKDDGTTTLEQYFTSKSTDYGRASLTPQIDSNEELKVHLFLPCSYTDYSAELDYDVDTWKYALPSMNMSGSSASLAASALNLSSTNLGGPTTIKTEETYTRNILWGRLDAKMREASASYEVEDEIGGEPISGVNVTLGNEDYSYVSNAEAYTIKDAQYLLFTINADKFISLCPPFNVKNIYVVESYPEAKVADMAIDAAGEGMALYYQAYANIDYCYHFAKGAMYSKTVFNTINSNFKAWGYKKDKEQNGYTGTQSAYNWRGVKKITPNVDFNLHENQEEWSIDENDNYTCDWATADGSDGVWMEKGRNYILQFPAKTANEYWDYWTGKMIILEGLGEETIQGSNAHAAIKASAAPSGEGKAVMLGNTTLAEMSVQNEQLYYYDEESGMFLSEPEAEVKIQPAQGFLYVNPKVDPEAPVEVFGIEAFTGKCWYFLTYGEEKISVERSAEKKTYKGLDSNDDDTEKNRYIYREDEWVEMTDEDNDHAWAGSNGNTYIYYADAWVIVTKENGLYTDGDENKYTYDDATSAWKRLSIDCGIYSYDDHKFMLINNVLTPVTLNANDPAYRVDGSDPAQFYLDPNGSCAWTAVNVNNDGAYYYGESPYHFYVYLNDEWVAVDRILDNSNWNRTYIDNSGNYYIRNNDNWLIITGPDENHLYHGSDSKIYIYYGNPADWVAVTHHEDAIYTDSEKFYEYNTTSSKWEVVEVDIVVEAGVNYPVVGNQTLHDLTIKDNGSVTIPSGNSLTVQNLIIEATPDNNQSGIINGAGMANLTVEGDVYLDITMNSAGEMDATKYYSFAVPFAVNRADGVQRLNKNTGLWETATFGANYLAYEYDEAERAANGPSNACWKKVTSDQYVPGKFYLCEFDNDNYNVYRFKASDKSQLNAIANISVSKSSDDALNAGWNGVSGMGISYSELSGAYGYMFALNSVANAFDIQLANDASLAVGRAVFVQVTKAGIVTINQTSPSAAPARVRPSEAPIHCVRITESGKQKYDDQLFFSASEEAQPVYVAGKDIEKMWMGTPSVARIWAVDYNGLRLAANDAVLAGERADYQLGISAPKNGEYVLALQESYEDVTVYLTQNGTIIANLTLGEYPISLEKGETAEYGLRIIVHKAPNVATDFDAAIVDNPDGVHKVIINDVIYIIKNKHVYTTNGQIVK